MDTFITDNRKICSLSVHSGTFHSDDVFCGALARLINPDCEIHRVRSVDFETNIENGIIAADIGFGPFDHHQKDTPYRDDGIKHCGASRMWLEYAYTAIHKADESVSDADCLFAARKIYDGVLKTIAALDNGDPDFPTVSFSIVEAVEGFRPTWNSDEDSDTCYLKAVDFMKQILINEIRRGVAESRAGLNVAACMEQSSDQILVLDPYCPWKKKVIEEGRFLVVIYPSLRGGWNLEPVPNEAEGLTYRIHIPADWRGTRDETALTVRKGMTFCHMAGFLAAFQTKEDALESAKWLIENCQY